MVPGKFNMEPENGPLEDYFPLHYNPVVFRFHVIFSRA